MEGFFDGLEKAVGDRNWYAALVLSLTLPDVCVKASDPARKTSRSRYAEWFDTYLGPKYRAYTGAGEYRELTTFLSGKDCYALRCALLHEGSSDTSGQPSREALDSFQFCVPGESRTVNHMNLVNEGLVLMVDIFAMDMLGAARSWWASLPESEQQAAESRMLVLHGVDADLSNS